MTHPPPDIVLALLLAHFIADYPLQNGWMVRGKLAGDPIALFAHLCPHLALTILAVELFASEPLLSAHGVLAVASIIGVHAVVDITKAWIARHYPSRDGALLYLADQLAHVGTVLAAATLFLLPSLRSASGGAQTTRLMMESLALLVAVFPPGYLIIYLLQPERVRASAAAEDDSSDPQASPDSGLYLGWMERGILVFAFAAQAWLVAVLVITGKALIRYARFAQPGYLRHFVLGTALSASCAAAVAYVLAGWRAAI